MAQDKYRPDAETRKYVVQEQLDECKRIIYRNDLENLIFKANGDKHKQVEVETNNAILKEKVDLLLEEQDRVNAEL